MGHRTSFHMTSVDLTLTDSEMWRLELFLDGARPYDEGGALPLKRLELRGPVGIYFGPIDTGDKRTWRCYRTDSGSMKGAFSATEDIANIIGNLGGHLLGFGLEEGLWSLGLLDSADRPSDVLEFESRWLFLGKYDRSSDPTVWLPLAAESGFGRLITAWSVTATLRPLRDVYQRTGLWELARELIKRRDLRPSEVAAILNDQREADVREFILMRSDWSDADWSGMFEGLVPIMRMIAMSISRWNSLSSHGKFIGGCPSLFEDLTPSGPRRRMLIEIHEGLEKRLILPAYGLQRPSYDPEEITPDLLLDRDELVSIVNRWDISDALRPKVVEAVIKRAPALIPDLFQNPHWTAEELYEFDLPSPFVGPKKKAGAFRNHEWSRIHRRSIGLSGSPA